MSTGHRALLIPVDPAAPVSDLRIPHGTHAGLRVLQDAVGGFIEQIDLPSSVDPDRSALAIVNEDGKPAGMRMNSRATALLRAEVRDTVGLPWGDYIVGDVVVIGVSDDADAGDVPKAVERRIMEIDKEERG
jgi:hypothetical protein